MFVPTLDQVCNLYVYERSFWCVLDYNAMRENVYHLFSWTGPQPEQPTTKSKQSYFQIMKRNESTGKKEKQLVYKPLVVLKLRVIISGQSRWAMIKLTKIHSFCKVVIFRQSQLGISPKISPTHFLQMKHPKANVSIW